MQGYDVAVTTYSRDALRATRLSESLAIWERASLIPLNLYLDIPHCFFSCNLQHNTYSLFLFRDFIFRHPYPLKYWPCDYGYIGKQQ